MAKDYTQVNFRIPTELKEKIEQSSVENGRSITAEIVSRLEASFTGMPQEEAIIWKEEAEALMAELKTIVAQQRHR